ncbi:DUF6538 domain-containing protein [Phaeobacter sp. S60]|uniref:DUF6538 domain-containing protein n=1 Tax=Phaeobacter sp. S60 TaxID=1569353 RepID=UPI003510A97E
MENISAKYLSLKEGIFYFNRRVPKDLRSHYSCSLRTRSRAVALARANSASVKLDVYWYHLRS